MGKKDKKSKVTESDRASVAASSFNAASAIIASGVTVDLKKVVEETMALTDEFFNVRLDWMTENAIGGAPKSTGGGGGSYKPSAASSGSSGQSYSAPTPKMVGFYGDLIDAIEKLGGEAKLSIKKFKNLNGDEASAALDDAIERRDNLK